MEERLNNLSAFSHSFLMEGALGTRVSKRFPLVSLRRKMRDAAIRGLSPIFAPFWFLRLNR